MCEEDNGDHHQFSANRSPQYGVAVRVGDSLFSENRSVVEQLSCGIAQLKQPWQCGLGEVAQAKQPGQGCSGVN